MSGDDILREAEAVAASAEAAHEGECQHDHDLIDRMTAALVIARDIADALETARRVEATMPGSVRTIERIVSNAETLMDMLFVIDVHVDQRNGEEAEDEA